MNSPPYTVSESEKKGFAGIFLLDHMVASKKPMKVFLEGDEQMLEPILEWLMAHEWLCIEREEDYAPTGKGREALSRFAHRYRDFLQHFDIYSAVDLEEGTFAFERYFDFKTDEEWNNYLDDERWEDLRIAVASFKQINPVELVFMHFVQERRFGFAEQSGWQFDLLLGSVWDKILNICNDALHEGELAYTDDETGDAISGREVVEDVIVQGAEWNRKLFLQEGELHNERNGLASSIEDFSNNHLEAYERYKDPNYKPDYWKGSLWSDGDLDGF